MKRFWIYLFAALFIQRADAQSKKTYAEQLGFPKGARVLLLHMDDGGMSYDSNRGIERVLQHGVARSFSVMMPCPWVPQIVRYVLSHPGTDAGLHLTLTSEWKNYRWGPLAGKFQVPGLTDPQGCLWRDNADVDSHASAREVGLEIHAQLDRAETMGFHPTHLDSHMGVLFDKTSYLMQYIHLGMENHIPVMFPGGQDTYIQAQVHAPDSLIRKMQHLGKLIWAAGLPVLDDLHNTSYDWKIPKGMKRDNAHLLRWREAWYEKTLLQLKPGLTMVIMHCTDPSPIFSKITDSGDIRKADMLVMLDPAFRKFLKDHGMIITTWRELAKRRALVGKS
ncbi:MAG: polysaccharide deacetylase family protein [Chitinophagaceae bacterium]